MESKKKKGKLDFYALLELEKTATQEEVKSQYRKLALRWHPDKNGGSEEATERFKLVSEAYSVLSNPERRRHYDRYGTVAEDEAGEEDFFSEFESMFFGGGGLGDMDEFMEFLESDTKNLKKLFRDMGKNVRIGMGARSGKRGGRKMAKGGDIEDMLSFFMMPGMMAGPPKKKKKAKKAQAEEDEGWKTEEEELD